MVIPLALDFWGHARSPVHELKHLGTESFRWDSEIHPDWQETDAAGGSCGSQGDMAPQARWSSVHLLEARVMLVIAGPFAQNFKPIKNVTYPCE